MASSWGKWFLCVDVPEEYGGYGAPVHYSLMLVQETAQAGFASLAVAIGGQNELVSPYLQNIGSEEQKRYWLPKMVTGEVVTAIAMTEANAGSDLQAIRTQAILENDQYRVNGSKTFISNGLHADLIVLVAKTDPQAKAKGISIFLVDAALDGVKKVALYKKSDSMPKIQPNYFLMMFVCLQLSVWVKKDKALLI